MNFEMTFQGAVAWSSSDDSAIIYAFLVLWMTSCFHIMEQIGYNQGRHVTSSSPGGNNGVKSATSDCISLLFEISEQSPQSLFRWTYTHQEVCKFIECGYRQEPLTQ